MSMSNNIGQESFNESNDSIMIMINPYRISPRKFHKRWCLLGGNWIANVID